jgi:acetoin utilization deacetylase AcuC-like enzyme
MLCVFTDRHQQHDPRHEVWAGVPTVPNEVPARAEAIRNALTEEAGFTFLEPRDHGDGPILAVHDGGLVRYLEDAWLDWTKIAETAEIFPDTVLHPGLREGMGVAREPLTPLGRIGYWCFETMTPVVEGTYEAARSAVDVALTAADAVLAGERAVYGLCRPPGHHAARSVFGGFCFFNNAAIAAQHIVRQTGGPIAILDVDFHHGNGTQQIFYGRGDVLYVSLHGDPDRAYPYFAGWANETGAGDGEGANLNIPLPAECTDDQYLAALDRALQVIDGFESSALVVSLGMDTFGGDPLGDFALTTQVYDEVGRRVALLGRRTVILQEGGYVIPRLGENVSTWLRGFEVGGGKR